jgi:hypothetical protein
MSRPNPPNHLDMHAMRRPDRLNHPNRPNCLYMCCAAPTTLTVPTAKTFDAPPQQSQNTLLHTNTLPVLLCVCSCVKEEVSKGMRGVFILMHCPQPTQAPAISQVV